MFDQIPTPPMREILAALLHATARSGHDRAVRTLQGA